MAGSVNKCILVGNLCADPEVRRTQDGKPIANLRVATADTWRDKSTGERKEKTEFHRVVIFSEGLAKVAEQYLQKGAKVYIEGALQTRKWTDKDNIERYSTEIVLSGFNSVLTMLDKPASRDEGEYSDEPRQRPADIKPPGGNVPGRGSMKDYAGDLDSEIPF